MLTLLIGLGIIRTRLTEPYRRAFLLVRHRLNAFVRGRLWFEHDASDGFTFMLAMGYAAVMPARRWNFYKEPGLRMWLRYGRPVLRTAYAVVKWTLVVTAALVLLAASELVLGMLMGLVILSLASAMSARRPYSYVGPMPSQRPSSPAPPRVNLHFGD